MKDRRHERESEPHDVPISLRVWLEKGYNPQEKPVNLDMQLHDLLMLPEETWAYFDELLTPNGWYDMVRRTAGDLRQFKSKQDVRTYFDEAVLQGENVRGFDSSHGTGGDGVARLYESLKSIALLQGLSEEQRMSVCSRLRNWEQAFLDVICDPIVYFMRTQEDPRSLSAVYGAALSNHIHLTQSPNIKQGEYVQRVKDAIDYPGILQGAYIAGGAGTQSWYRQAMLLGELFQVQVVPGQVSEQFWESIAAVPSFRKVIQNIFDPS